MEIDKANLTARVSQEICRELNIAYAYISSNLLILDAAENLDDFSPYLQGGAIGCRLYEAFPELKGKAEDLSRLLDGRMESLRLDSVNCLQPDGLNRSLNFTFFPIERKNPSTGLLLLLRDNRETKHSETPVSELQRELDQAKVALSKTKEDLQKLRQLKSLILSTAAHDMRTPLNAILGYSEWVYGDLPEDQDSENRELLSIIISQAQLLDHLISDLLDLDQIEQGKLRLTPRPCDATKIIRRVFESTKAMVEFQNQTLTLSLPEFPLVMQADPDRLTQILYNLMSNAIKYTPEGGHIQISAWKENDAGVLSIQDDGAAMSTAEQAQLFQLNFKKEGARRSLARGAGLGMYLVKTLVDAHRGNIKVVSHPNRGVAITIHLPLAQEEI